MKEVKLLYSKLLVQVVTAIAKTPEVSMFTVMLCG